MCNILMKSDFPKCHVHVSFIVDSWANFACHYPRMKSPTRVRGQSWRNNRLAFINLEVAFDFQLMTVFHNWSKALLVFSFAV